jgi:hypothetical protein
MDFGRVNELSLRLQHRHSDGTWGALEPRASHHDSAAHDPERDWATGTIYACTTCDEEVHVATIEDPADPPT